MEDARGYCDIAVASGKDCTTCRSQQLLSAQSSSAMLRIARSCMLWPLLFADELLRVLCRGCLRPSRVSLRPPQSHHDFCVVSSCQCTNAVHVSVPCMYQACSSGTSKQHQITHAGFGRGSPWQAVSLHRTGSGHWQTGRLRWQRRHHR